MLNLLNLMNLQPAQPQGLSGKGSGQTADAAGFPLSPQEVVSSFLEQVRIFASENAKAAEAAGEIDLKSILGALQAQAGELVTQLLAMLQSVQLIAASGPEAPAASDAADISNALETPEAFNAFQSQMLPMETPQQPVRELLRILEQLQQVVGKPQESENLQTELKKALETLSVAPKMDANRYVLVLAQAIETCKQIQTVQTLIQKAEHLVPVAQSMEAGETAVLQQTVVTQKTDFSVLFQPPQPAKAAENAGDSQVMVRAIQITQIQIQKVVVAWKELNPTVEIAEVSPKPDSPVLLANGLLTMVRLLKSQASPLSQARQTEGQPVEAGAPTEVDKANSMADFILAQKQPPKQNANAAAAQNQTILEEMKIVLNNNSADSAPKATPAMEILNLDMKNPVKNAPPALPQRMEQMIVDQIVERIQIARRGDLHQIQIRLEPPDLGQVHMKMEMKGPEVVVRFTVENAAVKQTLESNLGQLRDSLQQQGFRVERFDIHVGYGNEQPSHGKDVQDQWDIRRGWRNGRPSDAVPAFNAATSLLAYGLDTGRRYGYNTMEMFA